MTSKKVVTLKVPMYFTNDGVHTCAISWETGNMCQFLMTTNFGTKEHCYFGGISQGRNILLDRAGGDLGFLIPCEQCPLKDDNE